VLALAATHTITVPLHALLVRPRRHRPATGAKRPAARGAVRTALADIGFWLLALGFTAHTAAIKMLPKTRDDRGAHRGQPTASNGYELPAVAPPDLPIHVFGAG
jgi:hypothetical protein